MSKPKKVGNTPEGMIKKGGVNEKPSSPKPDVKPVGQKTEPTVAPTPQQDSPSAIASKGQ